MEVILDPKKRVYLRKNKESLLKFTDNSMNQIMSEFGIIIPKALQSEYLDQSRVYLEDINFLKAYKNFVFEHELKPKGYTWC